MRHLLFCLALLFLTACRPAAEMPPHDAMAKGEPLLERTAAQIISAQINEAVLDWQLR